MQGANSSVSYYSNYIIKEVLDDEEYGEPLDLAAMREAYLTKLAKQKYEFVPRVIGVSDTKIKMERINGLRLSDYILKFPSRKTYLELHNKVVVIVKTLIDANIDHRDVTWENLIVDTNDDVWIIDFGRAKLIDATGDKIQVFNDEMFTYVDTINDILKFKKAEDIIPHGFYENPYQ
jgi:tRNA A-37 threonylcarbamoyl transferase component Bud32